jgi:hypothetical protein
MKHFDITDWADFVRGVDAGIDRAAMDRHLSSGCSLCRRTVATLRATADLVSVDSAFEPSAHDIQRAEHMLEAYRPKKARLADRLVPRLVYDSLSEPALAGVRGGHRIGRQVLYQVGDFYLDLALQQTPDARGVRLFGQIADRRNPAVFPGTGPVLLKSATRTVRRAEPNEFHEFEIAYVPQPGLRLEVPVPGAAREPIQILLDELAIAEPRGVEPVTSASAPKKSRKARSPSQKSSRRH